MQSPKCLAAVPGLRERLAVSPPAGLAPHSVKDVKYLGRVLEEALTKGSVGFEVVVCHGELCVWRVMPQYWGASGPSNGPLIFTLITYSRGRPVFLLLRDRR